MDELAFIAMKAVSVSDKIPTETALFRDRRSHGLKLVYR